MRKLMSILASGCAGFFIAAVVLEHPPAAGGGATCAAVNGDVNADEKIDLADAITILGYLFLGSPTELLPQCAAPPAPSGLPATGQADCAVFDGEQGLWVSVPCEQVDCEGQDGSLRAGCSAAGRFVDNDDGTVTDTCTGLQWQKDTADIDGDGQVPSLGDGVVWCEALSYCEGLLLGGRDDWRLPNARELQSIVDYGRRAPSADPSFGALDQYYWSSTTYAESPDAAWGVGFNVGYVGIRTKAGDLDFSFNFVRAVRGP